MTSPFERPLQHAMTAVAADLEERTLRQITINES
jgi:hypothetical protein